MIANSSRTYATRKNDSVTTDEVYVVAAAVRSSGLCLASSPEESVILNVSALANNADRLIRLNYASAALPMDELAQRLETLMNVIGGVLVIARAERVKWVGLVTVTELFVYYNLTI